MDHDTSFGEALAALSAADPDAPAVTCDGVTLSRQDFHRRTNRLARAYADLGVSAGSYVTIGLPNGTEFLETAFAAWKLGAVPQPVSYRLPLRELDAILELVAPSLVVGLDDHRDLDVPRVPRGYRPDPDLADSDLPTAVAPTWKAPTSGGSTGRPKVILAGQPATLEAVAGFGPVMGFPDRGAMLTTGPMYHNGPFMTSAVGLLLGLHVVVMPRFDAEQSLALVQQHCIRWMYAVPTMMLRIWRLPANVRTAYDTGSLTRVLHMAAPCPPWLKRAWIDWLGPSVVAELYAGTEVQAITVIEGDEWLRRPGSVGRAVVGEIRVGSVDGSPLPRGTVGLLWMRRAPGEPPSYLYLGAEARRLPDGWESLGDLGWMDDEGYVYLADRESDMILVGGSNVYPAEVEAALEEHPAVRTSCVVGLPDDDLGQVVHAVLELTGPVGDHDLLSFCADRLVGYKLPRELHRSDTPLRDEAGKVRRSAVRDELIARCAARALG